MSRGYIYLTNQKGAALVIALLVMITATVVAICANFTSNTDLAISGNQRRYCEDFFTADGGLELVKSFFLDNYIFPVDVGDYRFIDHPDGGEPDLANHPSGPFNDAPFDNLGLDQSDKSQTVVRKVLEGNPPKGSGISAVYFRGNYYRARAVKSASITLEEEFCLVSPK